MPIQNFYIDCEIDGHKSRLTGGPRAKNGGFNLTVYQRDSGEKIEAVKISGTVRDDVVLVLDVQTHENCVPMTFNLKRLLTKR